MWLLQVAYRRCCALILSVVEPCIRPRSAVPSRGLCSLASQPDAMWVLCCILCLVSYFSQDNLSVWDVMEDNQRPCKALATIYGTSVRCNEGLVAREVSERDLEWGCNYIFRMLVFRGDLEGVDRQCAFPNTQLTFPSVRTAGMVTTTAVI